MRRRSRRAAVWATAVALTIAMTLAGRPHIAEAAPVLDQQQPTIDSSVGGLAIGGNSQQRLGQTVTAGMNGDLVQVDLPVGCAGTGDLIIEIRDVASGGSPGSTLLSTTTIAGTTLPSFPLGGVTFRTLTLATSVAVSTASKFAIVLNSTGTTASDGCGIFRGPVGDSYTGGDLYFDALPNTPGVWVHNCGEFPGDRCDLPFRTRVEAAAPSGADLSITKTLMNPSNLNVFADTDQTYQLTVANAGPSLATGVTIVDTLPSNVTVVQAHPACVNNAGVLTCSLGPTNSNLAAGGSFSIYLIVRFKNAGSYTNTASVSANETDPNTSNNTASHTQTVLPSADIYVSQVFAPGTIDPSGTLTYDVYVKNDGPDPAGQVVLLQTIPATSTFVSISSPDTTICGPGQNAGEYGCRFSSIPVNTERMMTVTVTAPASPQRLVSSFSATHIVPPFILDPNSSNGIDPYATWVVSETVPSQTVAAGGSLTSDTEGDGSTVSDPVETTVQTGTGGAVSIFENAQNGPTGATQWTFLGVEVVISAPAGSTSDPLKLTFRIDSEFLRGLPAGQVDVWRNYGNTPIPNCTQPVWPATPSTTTPISPDPCVWKRSTLSDGDAEIIVFTSQASVWAFAIHDPFRFGGFEPPMGSKRRAGSTLPVKFQLFDQAGAVVTQGQLDSVLASTPSSRQVSCASGVALSNELPIAVVGDALRFDSETNTWAINWKTDRAWAGTCRELRLELIDASAHTTTIRFD